MKDLKYYETLKKIELEARIKEDLKKGPVPITVDCTIKKESDLQKSSVQFSLRRTWRRAGQVEFERVQSPELRFIIPKPGTKLYGITLDNGVILPVFAPEILEDHELTVSMMREGLILHLQQKYDPYYHKLLLAFDLSDIPEQIQETIRGWGNKNGEN